MNIQQNLPPQWNDRLRWWRNGFIPGLILGILAGWFFHGVVSLIVRLGIIMIVLLPLLVIGYLWFRSSRRQSPPQESGGPRVMTWSNLPPPSPNRPAEPYAQPYAEPANFTDVPFMPVERPQPEPPRQPQAAQSEPAQPKLPVDVEAELQALKRQQGQTR